jgi:hypothetical protein
MEIPKLIFEGSKRGPRIEETRPARVAGGFTRYGAARQLKAAPVLAQKAGFLADRA